MSDRYRPIDADPDMRGFSEETLAGVRTPPEATYDPGDVRVAIGADLDRIGASLDFRKRWVSYKGTSRSSETDSVYRAAIIEAFPPDPLRAVAVRESARGATPGRKDDGGKLRASLLPKGTIAAVLRVLEFGAKKYGAGNWKDVPDARRRYYDAADRHLRAWWEGEANDPDTGESHLAHLTACALFLLAFELDKGAP